MSRVRYANSQLDDIASVLAASHPRANDYLAQAPVLAVLATGKFSSNDTYGEVDRFAAAVATGPKLRDLLASYGAPLPARKLVETALRADDRRTLEAVLRLGASALAQAIPVDSQRVWLDGINKWLRLTPKNKRERSRFSVAWIARQLGQNLSRHEQVDALVDYLGRGDGVLNEGWSWASAMERVTAWHQRLNDREAIARSLLEAGRAAMFDKVICKAPLPDTAVVEGLEFVVLRTARAIQEEGVALHHCVSSYTGHVARGLATIVSVRKDGVRIATLELSPKGAVMQLKAHCNAAAGADVRKGCGVYALLHWRPSIAVAA